MRLLPANNFAIGEPSMVNLPNRDCPICGGRQPLSLYEQRFHALPEGSPTDGYDVVICSDCGFAFADRIPPPSVFDEYYERQSRVEHAYRGGDDSAFDAARFIDMADYIARLMPDRNLRIVDIGCGRGGFLAQLKQRGYTNLFGLDPSAGCAKVVHDLYGIPAASGTIMSNDLPRQSFDLALLVGVLEHIPDLTKAMQCLSDILAPNGSVFIDVPDATSFQNCSDAPFQQFSVEHINFFGPQSLANLLGPAGYVPIDVSRLPRQQTKTTIMPCADGLFRKQENLLHRWVRDQETEAALRQYIAVSEQEEQRIARTVEAIADCHQKLIIWGAGTHTLHLLETTALGRCHIVAYVDSNPKLQGKQLQGRPIVSPTALCEYEEPVLISSRVFQDDIVCQIRDELRVPNQLVLLYTVESN
jgi:SAM-dependent methyltransferase